MNMGFQVFTTSCLGCCTVFLSLSLSPSLPSPYFTAYLPPPSLLPSLLPSFLLEFDIYWPSKLKNLKIIKFLVRI
jgi:hypothetical protein